MNRLNMSVSPSDRRGFLKQVSAAGLGLGLTPAILKGADDRKVRLGLIGIGGRGSKLLRLCLGFSDVSIPAVCDIVPDNLRRAQDAVEESGRSRPEGYGKDERSYLELLQRDDLDGVVIATPWELHIPMAVDSMKAGIYAGVEVGPANSIEECWELVETYEETRVPCMLLENNCYARYNMAILRMVRESVFGELIHCQCGYAHDLRERLVLGKGTGPTPKGEGDYRSTHNQYRNGELYPTHSIGPIAHCLNIQRGNRFEYLTSMATKSRGLGKWSEDNLPAGHPRRNIAWRQGDLVTTTIKCANEETVVVKFDTRLPRPNSFLYVVQGTKGIWMQDADSSSKDKSMIYLDGMEPPQPVAVLRSISGTVRTSAVEEIPGPGHPQRTWRNRLSGAEGLHGVHQAEDRHPHRRLRHGGLDGDLTPLRTIDPAIERTGGLPRIHPGEVDEQPALVRVHGSVLSLKPRRT